MKKLLSALLCGLCVFTLVGCGSGSSEKDTASTEKMDLTLGGSTSVQPLMEKLAEDYNKKDEGQITVQGGGSSVGIKGAIDGTFNVAMSSRALKDDEAKDLDATTICLDGIVIAINPENKVEDLTLEQAKDIFTGKITNWKEVGGADAEIAVVAREEGSGTRDGFESIVGMESDELIASAEIQNATGSVVSSVAGNENAIGYISMGAITDEIKTTTIGGVKAAVETVSDGSYKLQRPFVLAVKSGNKDAEALINFIFSDEGKKIIEDNGYVSVEK